MELINTVGDNIRRTPEFVGSNRFRSLGVDPVNYFGRIQRTADVRDSHLMFFEMVGETARTGSLVTRDLNIFASDRAVGEMNPGISVVHPCPAKPGTPQSDCAVALPTVRISGCPANYHPNSRRPLPLPFAQKLACFGRKERSHCLWRYGALNF